jgi:hypothetical protein
VPTVGDVIDERHLEFNAATFITAGPGANFTLQSRACSPINCSTRRTKNGAAGWLALNRSLLVVRHRSQEKCDQP